MAEFVNILNGESKSFLISVSETEQNSDPSRRLTKEQIKDKVNISLDNLTEPILSCASSFNDLIEKLPKNELKKVNIEFGISLDAECNIFVTKFNSGMNFKINLEWELK